MDTKMKQFEPIDPLTIESDTRIFGKLVDHEAASRDNIYYLAVDDTHAIIATHSYYTDPDTNESEWLTYQLEFPKAGLRWIVDTINNMFFKTPNEGGLPSGVYHYEEVIDGEELGLRRSMGLGTNENRQSGYTFTTDRKSTRLNSSHVRISYAVFCLKKKKTKHIDQTHN